MQYYGENGIIKKAEHARDMYENSSIEEEEKMNQLLAEYENAMSEDEVSDVGFNVTLLASSKGFSNGASGGGGVEGGLWYTINGEENLTRITSVPITLTNVRSIRFVANAGDRSGNAYAGVSNYYDFTQTCIILVSVNGMAGGMPEETEDLIITKDTTFYVTDYGDGTAAPSPGVGV